MEYKRLSKEQFEALHQEFATFLAANSIDKKEWDQLKETNRPSGISLDEFSDLVWNDVLTKESFVEHHNPNHLFLFECLEEEMNLILVKTEENLRFYNQDGIQWMEAIMQSDSVFYISISKEIQQPKTGYF